MMKLKKLCTLLLIISTVISVGCKKEPQQGEKGDKGDPGINGNANVKSTTVSGVTWTYIAPNYIADIPYSEITQNIVDQGSVLVYANMGSGYNQLPVTFYSSSTFSTSIQVLTYTGGVLISWTDSDLTQPSYPSVSSFKIVVMASSAVLANPSIDYTNYKEVEETFELTN